MVMQVRAFVTARLRAMNSRATWAGEHRSAEFPDVGAGPSRGRELAIQHRARGHLYAPSPGRFPRWVLDCLLFFHVTGSGCRSRLVRDPRGRSRIAQGASTSIAASGNKMDVGTHLVPPSDIFAGVDFDPALVSRFGFSYIKRLS